jgi:hypothetical protein
MDPEVARHLQLPLRQTVSLSLLLIVNKPLFTRVIMMSGDATLRQPQRMRWHDRMYMENVKLLGLENLTAQERVRTLRTMPAEDLVARLPMSQHWCAVVDGEFLVEDIDLGLLGDCEKPAGKPEWCEAVVIGDTEHDVSSSIYADIKRCKYTEDAGNHPALACSR